MTKITDQKNITPDAVADLEEMGCGDLIIALMKAMKPLKTGQVLKVRALDPWRFNGHSSLVQDEGT